MSMFNDLLLLNYYEGVYLGRIDYTEDTEEAEDEYFLWLANMAVKYDIHFNRMVTDENIKILSTDIENFLLEHIYTIDMKTITDFVMISIRKRFSDAKQIDLMDILEIIDNEDSVTEITSSIYDYCLDEIRKEYEVID